MFSFASNHCKVFLSQFSDLVEKDFVQPGEAEAKKKRLEERKRQEEADKAPRKRKKGSSSAEPVMINDDTLGVKIAKTR